MARVRSIAGVRDGLDRELRPLLQLATPVVVSELGWMAMGLCDIMLVGRVSAAAMGAVSIGSSIFFTAAVFGMGLLLGLDFVVAQAYGAGRPADCHRALVQGVYISLGVGVPLMLLMWMAIAGLPYWGLDPEVLRATVPFAHVLIWSLIPLLLRTSVRRYLQALGIVRPAMLTLLAANLVNFAAGWTLILGHFGAPRLGATGTAWATCISRTFMALALMGYALWSPLTRRNGLRQAPLRIDVARIRRLIRLGLPAALQMTLEVGVFGLATALAGRLDAVSLAAHPVALSVAAFTFMVPLGVSSAAAVRVGQALGRRDADAAGRAGWTSLLVG